VDLKGCIEMKTYTLLVLIGSLLMLLEVDMLNGFTVVDYAGVIPLLFNYYHSKRIIILHLRTNLCAGTLNINVLNNFMKNSFNTNEIVIYRSKN
jgi:hypothetical protein